MKKLVALLMTAVMAISLVACSSGSAAPAETKAAAEETVAAKEEAAPAEEAAEEAAPAEEAVAVDDPRFDANNEYIKALSGMRIGVADVYLGDEWCRQIADAFTKYGEIYGFEANNQDGEISLEKQVTQIENFVTQEYDYLFVDCAEDMGLHSALDQAKEKNIPVITYDSTSTWEDRVAFVTASNYNSGFRVGEKAKEYIENELGGNAKIVAITLSQPHTMERYQGFKDALADMPGVEIITEQDCGGNRETAANIINGIAEDYDLVFAVVPNACMGAVSALESLQKENVKVVAAGLFASDAFDKLRDNTPYILGGVTNDPVSIVTMVLELAGKNILNGEVQEDTTYFTPMWVDASNVNEVYPKELFE